MAGNPEGIGGMGIDEGKGNGIGGSPGTVKTGGAVLGAPSDADASEDRCGFAPGCAGGGVAGGVAGCIGGGKGGGQRGRPRGPVKNGGRGVGAATRVFPPPCIA